MTGEGDRRMVLHGSAVTHHLDWVEQHRHLVALPRGHAHHQGELGNAADALLGALVVEHTLGTPCRRAQHAAVAEQRMQRGTSAGEQL